MVDGLLIAAAAASLTAFIVLYCFFHRTKKALVSAEERFHLLSQAGNFKTDFKNLFKSDIYGIAILDLKGAIIDVNEKALEMFSVTREEALSLPVENYLGPSVSAEKFKAMFNKVVSGGNQFSEWQALRPKDGLLFYTEVYLFRIAEVVVAMFRDISERKQGEELFRTMSESSPIGVFIAQDGRFRFVNPQFEKLTGYREEDLLGQDVLMVVFEDDRETIIQNTSRVLEGKRSFPCEFRCVTKKGEIRWVLETFTPIWYQGKRAVLGNYIDITEYKRIEEELLASNQRLYDIIDFFPDPAFVVDRERKVIAWNRAIEEMSGCLKKDVLGKSDYAIPFYGIPRKALVDLVFECDRETEIRYEYVKRESTTVFAEVYIPAIYEGKGAHLWIKASPLYDSAGNFIGAIETIRDITERKRTEEQLKHLSLNDPLTGLYNRTYFEEEMKRIGDGRSDPVGIIVCDVDGLKFINDTLGHDVGDSLLVAAAGVIEESFRESDMVARIGGDEFAVLLPNSSEKVVEKAYERIRENVEWYNSTNPGISLSISIGFAVRDNKSKTMADLYKEADNNMYREKLHRSQSNRSAIVQTLMKALGERDFLTEGHADRIQHLVTGLAKLLDLPETRIADLKLLAQFHDIGKVGVPDSILFKPGPLTGEEFREMRRHCEIGYRIAQAANDLIPIADWIIKHHEWWNGNGYPLGLREGDIPIECRILAIADAYDAITSDRPYRKAMTHEAAVNELKRCAGTQFDPLLVEKFLEFLETEEGLKNYKAR